MKKLKFVLGLAGIFTLMMLSSCSNLDPFGKDTQNSNEKNYVSFTINTSPSGRFIAADSSYDITAVTTWELSYTEESTGDADPKTITYTKGSTTTDSTTTYLTKENDNLKVCNFPVGTYTFELTGTYTDGQSVSHTVYGKATKVEIDSDKTNSISIIVGSKRTADGTGSLDLTFTNLFSDQHDYEDLSVLLVKLPENKSETLVRNTDYTIENLELNINKTGILSGLYKIEITYPDYKISIDNGDCFVEVADNITTTKSGITLSCETKKIFYATNKESSYNGLVLVSPKNLKDLLDYISETDIEEQNISIYMDDESPEIDIDAVNAVKEKKSEKLISIYKGTSSNRESLSISGVGISIYGKLTIVPTVENKILEVSSIAVNQLDADAYTVTLKDGTSLNIENANLANDLTIAAIDSTTGKDNFLAYMETPFITVKTDTDISYKLKLSYVEENATQYTIVSQVSEDKTTYSYYLKPSSTSGLNVQSHTDAKITAQYGNDDTVVYTTGENVEIPYTNDTLTFSLSGIENSANITWYLNGKIFSPGSFNPYSNSEVNVDNYNTVTCLFSVDGVYYISEVKFKLVQIKTTAVYGYSYQRSSKQARIAYVNDYKNLNANSVYVKDKNSVDKTYGDYEDFYWCLDNASNLYVLWNMILYKYSYDSNSYNATEENIIDLTSDITEPYTVKDIYYNDDGAIYILEVLEDSTTFEPSTINVYQVNVSEKTYLKATNQNEGKLDLNQIAVYGSDIYVAGGIQVYKTCFEQNGETKTLKNPEEFYVLQSTDFSQDETYGVKISDLQIGDGCGNYTETLYALVRDSSCFKGSGGMAGCYYSRGRLLSISTKDSSSYKLYGSTDNVNSYTIDSNTTVKLYAPNKDSKTEFFGPTHFCAVVPKKLVILDDGFFYEEGLDGSKPKIIRKDGFMEFDIEKESLTKCSENINASEFTDSMEPYIASLFDYSEYEES